MGFPVSEAYGLPVNAKVLVGSVMANLCGSHYPSHMAMVEVSSQRVLVDKAFSVPKCVRLARKSHHSHKLLTKILGTVPREQRDDLSEIWGEELFSLAFSVPKCVRLARKSHHSHKLLTKILGTVPREQRDDLSEIWGEELLSLTSDFERQNTIGKPMISVPAQEENDTLHEKMMELKPLLEASGERNLRSIDITLGECPCHCLAQTVWYPEHSKLGLVCDVEETRSIGLPDHRQKVTILVVSTMLALRWIEEK